MAPLSKATKAPTGLGFVLAVAIMNKAGGAAANALQQDEAAPGIVSGAFATVSFPYGG